MDEIFWDELSRWKKFVIVVGFLPLSVLSWIMWIFILERRFIERYNPKGYNTIINPETLKLPYVFGYINLFLIFYLMVCFIFIN